MKYYKHLFTFLLCFFAFNIYAQHKEQNHEFFFGKKQKQSNGTIINSPIEYNEKTGYGFDYQSAKNVEFQKKNISSKTSIYFSVKLPEGNYTIDVVLGGKKCATTSVKAESRRLFLKEIKTDKKQSIHKTFSLNVRTPKIDSNSSIAVKKRNLGQLNWDDKLTLEFLGTPAIQSIKISPAKNVTTLFLAGDSTVTDQDTEPWASWGQFATNYFTSDIVIVNYAESGASLPSFKGGRRLKKILGLMQPGDYLFIEFGHNDEKIKGEGNGAWGLYTNLLKEFITEARKKGGIPVLCTPTQRRAFNNDGTLRPTHGEYPAAMRKVANDLQVPLIDITQMTTKMYEAWGVEPSRKAFVQYPANTFPGQTKKLEDNTHFNSFGANEIAKAVILGIQELKLDLVKYIKPNTPKYNPANPNQLSDWTVPFSTRFEIETPDGN
ncbi:rhamnogalacturonan acetylesterase [Wenyingzhuangia sp. IMCC45467]